MSLLSTAPSRRTIGAEAAPQRQREAQPSLRLVAPPAPARRRRVGMVGTLAVTALLIGVFALVVVHAMVVQAQFELDRLEQQVADTQGQLHAARLEVARLESPQSIADAATAIGMVHPTDRVWLEPVAP